jgi:hypothetical protein
MIFDKRDLYNSIQTGEVIKTKEILDNGFVLDKKTGEWALFLAFRCGNKPMIKTLKSYGARIRRAGKKRAKILSLK